MRPFFKKILASMARRPHDWTETKHGIRNDKYGLGICTSTFLDYEITAPVSCELGVIEKLFFQGLWQRGELTD